MIHGDQRLQNLFDEETSLILLAQQISTLSQKHPQYTVLCRQLDDNLKKNINNTYDFLNPQIQK